MKDTLTVEEERNLWINLIDGFKPYPKRRGKLYYVCLMYNILLNGFAIRDYGRRIMFFYHTSLLFLLF